MDGPILRKQRLKIPIIWGCMILEPTLWAAIIATLLFPSPEIQISSPPPSALSNFPYPHFSDSEFEFPATITEVKIIENASLFRTKFPLAAFC